MGSVRPIRRRRCGGSSREARRGRRRRPRPTADGRRDVRAEPAARAGRPRSRTRVSGSPQSRAGRTSCPKASSRSSSRPARRSCAWLVRLPALLRRIGADLVHTQYAVPAALPVPRSRHGARPLVRARARAHGPEGSSRLPARGAAGGSREPRASSRSPSGRSADLVELYDVSPDHVVVTPNGVDPAFHPAGEQDALVISADARKRAK